MDIWMGGNITFTVVLALALLAAMYAMTLMNRAIRLLEYKISVMENDMKLMSEEFKMLMNRERPDLKKIKPPSTAD